MKVKEKLLVLGVRFRTKKLGIFLGYFAHNCTIGTLELSQYYSFYDHVWSNKLWYQLRIMTNFGKGFLNIIHVQSQKRVNINGTKRDKSIYLFLYVCFISICHVSIDYLLHNGLCWNIVFILFIYLFSPYWDDIFNLYNLFFLNKVKTTLKSNQFFFSSFILF